MIITSTEHIFSTSISYKIFNLSPPATKQEKSHQEKKNQFKKIKIKTNQRKIKFITNEINIPIKSIKKPVSRPYYVLYFIEKVP